MVVNNLDLMSVVICPPEADTPLIIDPYAHLPGPLSLERFETVARWVPQVLDRLRRIQLAELPEGPILDVGRKLPAAVPLPYAFSLLAPERPYHPTNQILT
jgi:hypothetical protein